MRSKQCATSLTSPLKDFFFLYFQVSSGEIDYLGREINENGEIVTEVTIDTTTDDSGNGTESINVLPQPEDMSDIGEGPDKNPVLTKVIY